MFCVKLVLGIIQCCPFDLISINQCAYSQRWRNPIIGHFPGALAAPVCQEKAEGAPELLTVCSPLDQDPLQGEGCSGLTSGSSDDTCALSCFPTGKAGIAQAREGAEPHHRIQEFSDVLEAGGWNSMAVLSWDENQALSSAVVEKFNVFYCVPAFVFMCLSRIFR